MDVDSRGSESPLSDHGSDEFSEDKFHRSRSASNASDMSDESDGSATPSTSTPRNRDVRPAKRRRVGDYDQATPRSTTLNAPSSPAGSISSDSSGSVPNSPSFANLGPTHPLSTAYAAFQQNPNDPESADYTQVTRCQWKGCLDPEQGNMDNLVNHINDVHIPPRQKKYFCEWEGCARTAMPHTSAYALKAHMRSHTKEKPFMCSVPECDRSFTRSDALAKHMRTVHETEALRPSDPVPRGHTGGISQLDSKTNGNAQSNTVSRKLKLTFKKGDKPSSAEGSLTTEPKIEGGIPPLPTVSTAAALGVPVHLAQLDVDETGDHSLSAAVDMDSVPFQLPVDKAYYPPEIYNDMEEYEKELPPSQWFRLLRRQIRWAEEEKEQLESDLAVMKARTDDLTGYPTIKDGKSDEVGDIIRREEWSVVENLLERIGEAGLRTAQNGDVNGSAASDSDGNDDMFARVQKLSIWKASATA